MSTSIDLRPAELPVDSTRGDTLPLEISFYSDSANTIPIDLSTATITMDIRKDRSTGPIKKQLTEGSGLTVSGDDNETLIISTETDSLPYGNYVADVNVVFPGSIVRTYVRIIWTLHNDVTR